MCTEYGPGRVLPRCTGRSAAVVLFLLGPLAAAQAADDEPATFGDAIAGGKAGLDLRYRYEYVDQDGFAENANGSTLRLRLNYETARFRDWSSVLEFDYLAEVLVDDFDSGTGTSPSRSQFPVIADPDGADLNQLYFDYAGLGNTVVRIGRQRILLDNERFVGGVGWRQNEQTYDGVTLTHSAWPGTELRYSYITRVNRIFGDDSPSGQHDGDIHLLNMPVALNDTWALTPYAYFIDNDDVAAFSTTTFGIRTAGSLAVGGYPVQFAGEFAAQTDAASAPVSYRAEYIRLDAGLELQKDLRVGLGYEVLGGDSDEPGKAFRTPLATLHAFQGWADQFLTTPDAGIEDLFASVSHTRYGWKMQAVLHRFTAASGGADWGDELDVSVGRSIGDRYGLLLKAALFDADDPAFADVNKFWLMVTASY